VNLKTLKYLGAVVLLLGAMSIFIEVRDRNASTGGDELLFPDLKEKINDVTELHISRSGETEPVVLKKSSGRWTVAGRDNYPADFGNVRAVLLAIAEAAVIEKKTANPEMHGRLGLAAPDVAGSDGVLVELSGEGLDFRVILGNTASTGSRYARIADQAQSWLINKDPKIPDAADGWLLADLLDIQKANIQQVTIDHDDGESIRISKETADDLNFTVSDIPEGRELSYATVADGIAGALSGLTLEDVRLGESMEAAVTTEFITFDGLSVTIRLAGSGDDTWLSVAAGSTKEDQADAIAINERVEGWQFKIPKFKAGLLTRRWEDILQAMDK